MGNFFGKAFKNSIIVFITFVLLIITSIYASKAVGDIKDIKDYKKNDDLKSAKDKLSRASWIGWTSVTILGIGGILLFIFAEIDFLIINIILTFVYLFIIAILIWIGVLSFEGERDIKNANIDDDKGAAKDALIAAGTSIGALGLVIILIIIYIIVEVFLRYEKKKKKKKGQKELLKDIVQFKLEEKAIESGQSVPIVNPVT